MNKFQVFFEAQQEKGAFKGLKFDELTDGQAQQLTASYLDHLGLELKNANDKLQSASEDNEGLKAQVSALEAEVNTHNKSLSTLQMKLANAATNALIEANKGGKDAKTLKSIERVKTFMKDLKELALNKGTNELTLSKADIYAVLATKADTLTTSVQNSTRGQMDPVITRLANRVLTAYDSIPSKPQVSRNQGGTYKYIDQDAATSVRAAALVAEGAAFPESTIGWDQKDIKLVKHGDHIPYSDEFEYDYNDFMQELARFLQTNVEIVIDDYIIDEMFGIIPAYIPAPANIADPNIFDLSCKVSQNITDAEGSKYRPNVMYMNSDDIVSNDFLLKKDANNNYMNLKEMAEAKGFTLIENNRVPANQMVIGDNRYIHVPEDGNITIKRNVYAGNDQIEGITRMLVQTRKALLIKELELTGWRQVTDIQAALTTLSQ